MVLSEHFLLREHHNRLQCESFRAFLDLIALDRTHPERVRVPVLVLGAHRDSIHIIRRLAEIRISRA